MNGGLSFERDFRKRDIWYVNLLHFTGPVQQPDDLERWVQARRSVDLGTAVLNSLRLVRFELSQDDVPGMRPVVLGGRLLAGA